MTAVVARFASEKHPDDDFTVVRFEGLEATNEIHVFRVVVRCAEPDVAARAFRESLVGFGATLTLHPDNPPTRSIRGHVREVRIATSPSTPSTKTNDDDTTLEIELVSWAWLLTQRTQSRIFQDKTAMQIVDTILDPWGIERTWKLVRRYAPLPYVTQFNETDYDFLRRILAREGIALFSVPSSKKDAHSDALVFVDEAVLLPAMEDELGETSSTAPSLTVHRERPSVVRGEFVFDAALATRVRPGAVRLADYDFRKPALEIVGKATAKMAGDASDAANGAIGERSATDVERKLTTALFHDAAESDSDPNFIEYTDARAAIVLQQERRDRAVLLGSSTCWRVRIGHKLALETSDDASREAEHEWVPCEVRHVGATNGRDPSSILYENTFVCVPAATLHRPARMPLVHRAVTETAVVVGEGDEIVTDAAGRVKVRFHWASESSCWLRVASPWAGAAFGAQFTPRVGTEVLVSFLGGDMDRPVVVGALFNGTHLPPFPQAERSRSGLRSKSIGGTGYNELSFDDAPQAEELRLTAERNMTATVKRDHVLTVQRNQVVDVKGEQRTQLGEENVTVLGTSTRLVNGEHKATILGGYTQTVGGNADLRTTGTFTQQSAREYVEVQGPAQRVVREDMVARVKGHALTIVGEHDRRTSSTLHVEGSSSLYSVGATTIQSDSVIELRCGQSMIRIGPDAIELDTPSLLLHAKNTEIVVDEAMKLRAKKELVSAAPKILLQSTAASVALAEIAKIDGTLVKLNCGPEAPDVDLPKLAARPPTTIALVDQAGAPIKNQRFRLLLADGSERAGFLDEEGRAELVLDDGGEIVFPDVDNPRRV